LVFAEKLIVVWFGRRGLAFLGGVFQKCRLAAAGNPLNIAINSTLSPVFINPNSEVSKSARGNFSASGANSIPRPSALPTPSPVWELVGGAVADLIVSL
jgi:hypothetical protein